MLVQEVSALFDLVSIQGATKLDVLDGLSLLLLELGHPIGFVPMNCNVQLLKHTEVGARRRPNQQIWRLFPDLAPSKPLVVFSAEVPPVRKVK